MAEEPALESVTGLRLGRYEIVRPLGEGGMAQVYLALRLGAGDFAKPIVLKVLHSRYLAETHIVDMFLEEARVLARLQHPNIVSVFEVERLAGVPYLAMEYVHGPTMSDLQRHIGRPGPDTMGPLLLLVRQICDALHYAHTLVIDGRHLGLVHRDVSSQNIVIDAGTGTAKLIDFGIAKAEDSEQHTEIGVLKGKIHYMSPEVLAGNRPDARADVYSVGVLLYRIWSGRAPFRRAEIFEHHPPPELTYPPGIDRIVEKATMPDREQRYASAADLADDLQRLIDKLGTKPVHLPAFVARIFPRGEQDWRPLGSPQSAAAHRSLLAMAAESSSLEPASGDAEAQGRAVWLALGITVFAAVLVALAALAVGYEVLFR